MSWKLMSSISHRLWELSEALWCNSYYWFNISSWTLLVWVPPKQNLKWDLGCRRIIWEISRKQEGGVGAAVRAGKEKKPRKTSPWATGAHFCKDPDWGPEAGAFVHSSLVVEGCHRVLTLPTCTEAEKDSGSVNGSCQICQKPTLAETEIMKMSGYLTRKCFLFHFLLLKYSLQ